MAYARNQDAQLAATPVAQYALLQTPGAAIVTTGPTDEPFGVAQDSGDASARVSVITSGTTKVIADGVITAHTVLMPAAAGRVAVHDAQAASLKIGESGSETAGAQGDHIEITFYGNKTIADA